MEDQELGLDRLRLLHASHDARFYRPLHPGDVVAIRGLLDRVDPKKTGLLVTGRLYGFVAGDLAVEATTVFFVRGDHRLDPEAMAHPATSQPDGGASELGPPHTTVSWTVAPDQSTRYAEASLDHNPVHVDPEAALQAGFANLTVHGLCTQAMAGHSILKHLAWNDARSLGRLAARFRRPVFNNSQLTTRMWVHGERVDFDVIDPNGVVVLSDGIAEIAGLGQ
jgi:acyl dehydratase